MASVIERNNRYCVVYYFFDENGKKKQKWESYRTASEAKKRKKEIEYTQELGSFVVPKCNTIRELLDEYVTLYGKSNWTFSTYEGKISLIDNYIIPFLGDMKIKEVNTLVLEKYYQQLLRTKAVPKKSFGKEIKKKLKFVSASTVKDIHKILRSCFVQAEKWDLIEKNPCTNASVPKVVSQKREIWTADTLFKALSVCEDDRLKLAINLTFSCSLRIGELLGLTWDCVDISDESMQNETPSIQINKEIIRVNRSSVAALDKKDVIAIFPSSSKETSTIQILKTPKTTSSIRKVFLPKSVAEMLIEWKLKQDAEKDLLGNEYLDYNLVFAGPFGTPVEGSTIRNSLKTLIEENDLPPIVFHSLRHSSITYKLKLNGGDIKAVQGDSGHSQAQMVTDQYSHILDEGRVNNARLFEDAFYGKKNEKQAQPDLSALAGIDIEKLNSILQNPEIMTLLQALGQKSTTG